MVEVDKNSIGVAAARNAWHTPNGCVVNLYEDRERGITKWSLCSQAVELLRRRLTHFFRVSQLSLANGMHDFNPSDRTARRLQGKDVTPNIGHTDRFRTR